MKNSHPQFKLAYLIPFLAFVFSMGSAKADRHTDNLITNVVYSSQALFADYRADLRWRGIRKPKGIDAQLYSRLAKVEQAANQLAKRNHQGAGREVIHKMTQSAFSQLSIAEKLANSARVSPSVRSHLVQARRALTALERYVHGGPRYREQPRSNYRPQAPRGGRDSGRQAPRGRPYRR